MPAHLADEDKKETPSLIRRKPAKEKEKESAPVIEEKSESFDEAAVEKTWAAFKEDKIG